MSDLITPPPRTSELVVGRMQDLIRNGRWPVGRRIPAEPELVEQFGVGRNTIREAVRALEYSGMLVPRRGDGTYVRSRNVLAAAIERCLPGSAHLELLGARRGIEGEAAAAAAERVDADGVSRLRDLLRTAESALSAGEVEAYAQADIAFHAAVVAESGNGLLIELYGGIIEVMQRLHASIIDASVVDGVHPVGHHDLVDAIAAGDPERARTAVHSYLEQARRGLS